MARGGILYFNMPLCKSSAFFMNRNLELCANDVFLFLNYLFYHALMGIEPDLL